MFLISVKVITIKNEDCLPEPVEDGLKLATVVMRLSVPTFVFTHIASSDAFLHQNSCIRHEAISTLLLCFQKLQKFMMAVEKRCPDKRSSVYMRFHNIVTKTLEKVSILVT